LIVGSRAEHAARARLGGLYEVRTAHSFEAALKVHVPLTACLAYITSDRFGTLRMANTLMEAHPEAYFLYAVCPERLALLPKLCGATARALPQPPVDDELLYATLLAMRKAGAQPIRQITDRARRHALAESAGSISAAAKILGGSRTHLHKLLSSYRELWAAATETDVELARGTGSQPTFTDEDDSGNSEE
jgi:hypothetical protein